MWLLLLAALLLLLTVLVWLEVLVIVLLELQVLIVVLAGCCYCVLWLCFAVLLIGVVVLVILHE